MDYMKHYVFDYYITCYQWLLVDGSQNSGVQLEKKKWVIKFLKHVIHDTLIMVSPILPFNTENIFQAYTRQNKISLGMLSWPQNLKQIESRISAKDFSDVSAYKNLGHQLNELLIEHMDRLKVKDRSYFDIVFRKNTELDEKHQLRPQLTREAGAFLRKLGEENLAQFFKVNKV